MKTEIQWYRFTHRSGFVLQKQDRWAEASPLLGFSQETEGDLLQEILAFHQEKIPPRSPSLVWAFSCLEKPFPQAPFSLPLAALHSPREGFSTLKLKIGDLSLKEALLLVKKYLPHYRLRLDCNRKWSLEKALRFTSFFSIDDFDYIEEPTKTFEELCIFSEKTGFPIGADESMRDSPFLQIPSLKAAIIKPTLMGKWPSLPSHVIPIFSSSYESSLSVLHIACLADPSWPHGLDTLTEDGIISSLQKKEGFLHYSPSDNPVNSHLLCPFVPSL